MSTLISDRSCLECSIEGESEAISKLGRRALPSSSDTCQGRLMGRWYFHTLLSQKESEGDGGISLILFFGGQTPFETFIYCNSFYS